MPQQETTILFFFQGMGPWIWVLLPLALITLFVIIKGIIDVLKSERDPALLYRELQALPFWGSITAMLGFIGQITGLWRAIAAIIVATDISPAIVMMGFKMSFFTTIFGLATLMVALVSWFVLTRILNNRLSA